MADIETNQNKRKVAYLFGAGASAGICEIGSRWLGLISNITYGLDNMLKEKDKIQILTSSVIDLEAAIQRCMSFLNRMRNELQNVATPDLLARRYTLTNKKKELDYVKLLISLMIYYGEIGIGKFSIGQANKNKYLDWLYQVTFPLSNNKGNYPLFYTKLFCFF